MSKRHFITGNPQTSTLYMSDEEYALALDCKVLQCLDILATRDDGRVLLGKRTRQPQKDWWVFGGAMPRGYDPQTGVSMNFRRETSVQIEPERFQMVGWYSLLWELRAQQPQTNGCHTTTTVYSVALTEDEIALLTPDDEYSAIKWVWPQDVLDGDYHPALKTIIEDYTEKTK